MSRARTIEHDYMACTTSSYRIPCVHHAI